MSDTQEILKQILNDEKLLNSRAFRDRVYKDVPLIRTAAQLKKPETPSEIKAMKEMAFTPEAYWKTSAWLFYEQGKFMEHYEDEFELSKDFVKYYPTYRDLTTEQLRGYFSWRTKVRRGDVEKAPLPYAYLYIYELINCIGDENTMSCFFKLKKFGSDYVKLDESISKYIDVWLSDFIVYYGLSQFLAKDLSDVKYEKYIITLMHWEKYSENRLFEAISALSAYKIKNSLYYAAEPDDFKRVLVRSFISLSEFYRNKRKKSLCSKLFGDVTERPYNMFNYGIFCNCKNINSYEYILNEIHSYTCTMGKWKCRKLHGIRGRNSKLGNFVRAVDSLLREKADFKHKISCEDVSKTAVKVIEAEIDKLYEEKRRLKASKIEIDFSKLSGIRMAADITREKLLVDEEFEPAPIAETAPVTEPAENADCPLDCDELLFMRALLYGGNADEAAKSCGKMVSILADSINERLFDMFGDTVIDFSADVPRLIEDYTDDLKDMIPKE